MSKKLFFILLGTFFLFSKTFAFTEETEQSLFSFSVSPKIGLMNGTISEFVIDPDCANTNNIESRLDWDIKNIPVISSDFELHLIRFIYTNFNFHAAVPKSSGYMQDYDWLNSLYDEWADDDPTELTNYSISNNRLNSYYSFGFRVGGTIPLPLKIRITPFISYEYEYLDMTGSDGYYSYKDRNWKKIDLSGKVISYKQEYNAFLLGLDLQSESIPHTFIDAAFMIAPYTTSLKALDIHHVRSIGFLDDMPDSLMLKGNASLMYSFSKNHKLGLSGYIQYIPCTSGPDYMAYVNSNGQATSSYRKSGDGIEGGTQRLLWEIALVYSFAF